MLIRCFRHIRAFGLPSWSILALAPLGLLFIYLLLHYKEPEYASYLWSLFGLSLVMTRNSQSRLDFLNQCFTTDLVLKIRLIEVGLILLPFILGLLIDQQYILVLFTVLAAFLSVFLVKIGALHITLPTPFGKHPFEFLVGFRKYFIVILLAYGLCTIAWTVNNFNLGLFSVFVLGLLSIGFYSHPEPLYYIWIHKFSGVEFLWSKIRIGLFQYLIMVLPVVLILLWMDAEKWAIILLIILLGMGLLLMSMLGKYAYYPSEIPLMQGFTIAFSIVFPPLMVFIIPLFYLKALKSCRNILL